MNSGVITTLFMQTACAGLLNFGLTLTLVNLAHAEDIVGGQAEIIDGDTFVIGETTIRLADIDAPELAQRCEGGPKALRHCGDYVASLLANRIRGERVRCKVQAIDDYDRRLALCEHAGEDLSAWLVVEGWALAYRRYSTSLVELEEQARDAGKGIWATRFEAPWDYRAKRWQVGVQTAPDGCPIKGNISREGELIYHTPWGSRWYARTKVSTDQGERWFCSEREALRAGWRAPRR